jgi:thymidylate synthase
MFLYENLSNLVNFREIINEKFKNEDNETLMYLLVVEELMSLHVKNSKNNFHEFLTKNIKIQTLLTNLLIFCCIENKEKLISILNKQKKILEDEIFFEKVDVPEKRIILLSKFAHFNDMVDITRRMMEI